MDFLWFVLAGLFSGAFAGMGMGGGTFLLPILTLLLAVDQQVAQGVNLIVFLPMAVVVIIIYACQKLIDFKGWWLISMPACLVAALGAWLALNLPADILKIIFGVFLVVLAIAQLVVQIIAWVKQARKRA